MTKALYDTLKRRDNYDAGSIDAFTNLTQSKKISGRLGFNLSDVHYPNVNCNRIRSHWLSSDGGHGQGAPSEVHAGKGGKLLQHAWPAQWRRHASVSTSAAVARCDQVRRGHRETKASLARVAPVSEYGANRGHCVVAHV